MLKKNLIILFTALAVLIVLFMLGTKFLVCQHQRGVTMELKQWENEFKGVNSFDEAIDAIEWYEYVSNYYVPSDGYYCSKKMSSKLEAQRSRNIAAYVKALEEYSGLDYGDDLQKWKDWVEKKKAEESSADQ